MISKTCFDIWIFDTCKIITYFAVKYVLLCNRLRAKKLLRSDDIDSFGVNILNKTLINNFMRLSLVWPATVWETITKKNLGCKIQDVSTSRVSQKFDRKVGWWYWWWWKWRRSYILLPIKNFERLKKQSISNALNGDYIHPVIMLSLSLHLISCYL